MPGTRTGRIDFKPRQACRFDSRSEYAFRQRTSTDVAEAHEQYFYSFFRCSFRGHSTNALSWATVLLATNLVTQQGGPNFLSVSGVVRDLKRTVEDAFGRVYVCGEVSSFKRHASGHCYLVLKDDKAQLRAVIWRSTAARLQLIPRDGVQVEIRGRVTMYEPRGEVQLTIENLRLAGEGAAQRALEALKKRLGAEGLFSPDRKKRLPRFPERIGIVTSGSGAAIQDMIRIIGLRYPIVSLVLNSVRVQGVGAPASIAKAVELFGSAKVGSPNHCDVVIVGRGGGSAEDLWAFNEEVVARAIASCPVPVISAVGHESDYTVADLVADVRAATPSHAGELVVPDRNELAAILAEAQRSIWRSTNALIQDARQRIDYLLTSYYFRRTLDRVGLLQTNVRDLDQRIRDATTRAVHERKQYVSALYRQLYAQRTDQRVRRLRDVIADLSRRLDRAAEASVRAQRLNVSGLKKQLQLSNPERPLKHGWSLIETAGGLLKHVADAPPGTELKIRVADGRIRATVDASEPTETRDRA